jgi:hypothetical protein
MLNDHTKWVNPDYVCHGEMERDRERDCKTKFKHTYHDGNAYCGPMHDFIACMCNACEYDVEKLLGGFQHFGHCDHLERVKEEQPGCQNWWTDECASEPGKGYCSTVVDSDAWKRLQPPPPPPPDIEWDDDGMKWEKFCSDVVKELAVNPEQLGQNLGLGWEQWCIEKFGVNATQETPPWGTGLNGHPRLPISGMPAPRFFDHEDSVPAGSDPIGNVSDPIGSVCSDPIGSVCSDPIGSVCSDPIGSVCSDPIGSVCSDPIGNVCVWGESHMCVQM